MTTTTTTLGAITPGEAKAHCETYRDPASDEYETRVWVTVGKKTICDMPEDCEEQDPDLIADAFNTANKTGKLPSQLLQERDELVGALQSASELAGIAPWVTDPEMKKLLLNVSNACRALLSKYPKP